MLELDRQLFLTGALLTAIIGVLFLIASYTIETKYVSGVVQVLTSNETHFGTRHRLSVKLDSGGVILVKLQPGSFPKHGETICLQESRQLIGIRLYRIEFSSFCRY